MWIVHRRDGDVYTLHEEFQDAESRDEGVIEFQRTIESVYQHDGWRDMQSIRATFDGIGEDEQIRAFARMVWFINDMLETSE